MGEWLGLGKGIWACWLERIRKLKRKEERKKEEEEEKKEHLKPLLDTNTKTSLAQDFQSIECQCKNTCKFQFSHTHSILWFSNIKVGFRPFPVKMLSKLKMSYSAGKFITQRDYLSSFLSAYRGFFVGFIFWQHSNIFFLQCFITLSYSYNFPHFISCKSNYSSAL